MDNINYGNNRWQIIYDKEYQNNKIAIDMVYGAIDQYVPYILTVKVDIINEDLKNINPVFIGTPQSNRFIKELCDTGVINLKEEKQAYVIKVSKSIYNQEKQMIVIASNDSQGLLYGAVEFTRGYLSHSQYTDDHYKYLRNLFVEELPLVEIEHSPVVMDRAIWTWGHVIYDYKKFIDNMVKLKLNMLVVWNDFLPINSEELVEYAHKNFIKIVWGFSWGWGEEIDIRNESEYQKWAEKVLMVYKEKYAHLKGDGIYFQTFTETEDNSINDMLIAEAAVKWVNKIGSAILEEYPELHIQFGLHATSVKDNLDYISNIDKRIHIVWEDCGSFPYDYIPKKTGDFESTLEFTKKISNLRGADDKFGVVLKGHTCLAWKQFEHQKGPFVLGKHHDKFIKERTKEKEKIWRYIQAYWLKNGNFAYEIVKEIVKNNEKNAIIEALVEDGMFEEKIWMPVAIYAKMLWDTTKDILEIMCEEGLKDDVYFS